MASKVTQKERDEQIKKLCERDDLKEESNFGQMKELYKEFAQLLIEDPVFSRVTHEYGIEIVNKKNGKS